MEEIVVNCPLSDINRFRETKQGVMLEQELCGSVGCLANPTLNPWKVQPFNPAEGGMYWLDWGKRSWSEKLLAIYDQKLSAKPDAYAPRSVPWRDVRIYLQKPSGASGSPCDTSKNDTVWAEIVISNLYSKTLAPGYSGAAPSDITDGEKVVIAGCPTVFLTNGDKLDGSSYDILSFMFSPQLPGPGTYSVSATDIVDGGYENVFFSTPQITNFRPAINGPVVFSEKKGTITIESFGTNLGDKLEGSFDFTIQASNGVGTAATQRTTVRAASEIKK